MCPVKPKAVFVETNWVVDIIAPAHLQSPQALQLLEQANGGEFALYVPAICLAEARETVPRRFTPRSRSEDFRKFVRWARETAQISTVDAEAAFRVFEKFDGLVAHELTKVSSKLKALFHNPGLHIFPLSEQMLERQVELGSLDVLLKPYDLAILSAILVQAEALNAELGWTGFCELDSDLQPWDKTGQLKPLLSNLYRKSHIWVYPNFLLDEIAQLPANWNT